MNYDTVYNRIEVYRRDDTEINFDEDFDVTGGTIKLTVKKLDTDLDASALITKTATLTVGTGGVYKFTLIPSDTENIDAGNYHFDVQLKNASSKISTIHKGIFIIKQDVTIATT